jgi:hypothetical protein
MSLLWFSILCGVPGAHSSAPPSELDQLFLSGVLDRLVGLRSDIDAHPMVGFYDHHIETPILRHSRVGAFSFGD